MNCREEKYNLLRRQLDSLGYNQPLSMESLPLVSSLLSDISLYKDRFSRYKAIAQNALQKNNDLESIVNPLQEENDNLRKENNFLHFEFLQSREQFEKNLKGLRSHISDLESAYSDLEFANMELISKIGALEEQIISQSERLSKYERVPEKVMNKSSYIADRRKNPEMSRPTLPPSISSVNNYISNILSHKSPQELAKEVEKLKSERKKLADSIDFYQNQILARDEEIKRLSEWSGRKHTPISSSGPACRCHTLDLDDDHLASGDYDVRAKFDDLNKKLQTSTQNAVKLAEQMRELERRFELQAESSKRVPLNDKAYVCLCREIERLQDFRSRCYCHNGNNKYPCSEESISRNRSDLINMLENVTDENDRLKTEIQLYRHKASEPFFSTYKQLLSDYSALKNEFSSVSEQLKLAVEEKQFLSESNKAFQKTIENLKQVKKTVAKSVSTDFIPSKLLENIPKKKGPISHRKTSTTGLSNNLERNGKSGNEISCDFALLKKDIIKEVESVCKQYIPSNPPSFQGNEEKMQLLTIELEKMKGERDYYCKEYHSLQDKILSSQGNKSPSATVHHRVVNDEKQDLINPWNPLPDPRERDAATSVQVELSTITKQNEIYREKINFLEERIKALDAERVSRYHEHEKEKERTCYTIENQHIQNEISSLRQQLMELQHELHYEKCENKMNKLKLEDTVKFLEMEKNKSSNKTEELISKIHYLDGSVDSLNKKIQELLSENLCLQSQYNNLRAVNEHLERSLKNGDASLQKCERELSEALRQLKLLEEEKKNLAYNISAAQMEAQAANEKMFVIAKDKDNLMEKLDMKTVEVCRLEKENSRQHCMINQLEEKISRLNCQAIRNNNEESRSQNEISNLKRELEKCVDSKNKLLAENRNLQSDMTSLIKDNEIKFNENENYKAEIVKLKEQLQNYVEEVRRVEQILEAKELEREEMLEQFKTLSTEAMHLENNYHTLESEKKWTSNSLRAAQEKLQDLEASVVTKDSLVSGLENQIMELSNELYSLKNELSLVHEENLRMKHEVESSKELINLSDTAKKKYESEIQALEQQIQQVSFGISQSDSVKQKLSSHIEVQKEVISSLENAVSSSRKEAAEQSFENHSVIKKIDELQSTVNVLQEQLALTNDAVLKYQKMCEEYKNKNLQLQREIINEKFEKVKAEETQSFSTSL